MCGCTKISGMKGRGKKKGSFEQYLKMGAVAGAAMVGGQMLSAKVEFLNQNETLTAGAKIAGGAVLASQAGDLATAAGVGLIADGVFTLISSFTSGSSMFSKGGTTFRVAPRQSLRGIPQGRYIPRPSTPVQTARPQQAARVIV